MRHLRPLLRTATAGRTSRLALFVGLMVTLFALTGPAFAVAPDEILQDATLEGRARDLSRQLRCLVCQNQSIDDSDAPLAKDLRVLVRERLTKGDTDAQAMAFIVDRYGTFVLLKPPLQGNTLLLWIAPLLLLAAILIGFRQYLAGRVQAPPAATPLSPAEARRLKALLGDQPKK